MPRYQFYLARPWVGSKARERQPLAPGQIGEHGPLFLAINEGIADHIDQLLYESFRTSFWDKPKAMINDRHVLPGVLLPPLAGLARQVTQLIVLNHNKIS